MWSEINFDDKYLDIKADKMKTKHDFVLPISNYSIQLLKEMESYSRHKSEYVFPSPTTTLKPLSDAVLSHALYRLGYKDRQSTHGFRSSFSTTMYELANDHKISTDVIESLLAHCEKNQIKAAYNRDSKFKYFKEKTILVNFYNDWLNNL